MGDDYFITSDRKIGSGEIDQFTKGAFVEVSVEQLKEFGLLAAARKAEFDVVAKKLMTDERAAYIKTLREHCSWRVVAANAYEEWSCTDDDWFPRNNQLAGMALCEAAAARLGEDYLKGPWV